MVDIKKKAIDYKTNNSSKCRFRILSSSEKVSQRGLYMNCFQTIIVEIIEPMNQINTFAEKSFTSVKYLGQVRNFEVIGAREIAKTIEGKQ